MACQPLSCSARPTLFIIALQFDLVYSNADVSSSYSVMVLDETSVDDPSMQHFQFSGKPFSCPGRVNFYNIALQWHFTYSNTDVFRLQSISVLDEASADDH